MRALYAGMPHFQDADYLNVADCFSRRFGMAAIIGCFDGNGLPLRKPCIASDIRQAPEKLTDYRDFAGN